MAVVYTKTYTSTCLGDLLNAINDNVTITTTLEQIIYAGGATTDFLFASTLLAGEETELDNVLASFVCPVYEPVVDAVTLNDTLTGTDTVWSSTKIENELAILDHGNLLGLGDDDHPQYHDDIRGDARYYTQTSLDAGQLDNRYYTETELDAGQLDNRYYTETEVDTLLIHTHQLSDLSDVYDLLAPTDGQFLVFDTTNGWQAETHLIPTSHTELTDIGTNTHAQIDSHIASTSNPHGTTLVNLSDTIITGPLQERDIISYDNSTGRWIDRSYTEADIATASALTGHTTNTLIHFTEASIDHNNILNVGTNTHAQIDSHLANTNNPHGTTVANLTDTVITSATAGDVLYFNGTNWVNQTVAGGTDELVKVSATDTTPGFLTAKLVAGTNITFTTLNSGANEQIEISASTGSGGEANTASNIGVAGVGVYAQQVGVDLQFKNINAGSTLISVVDDVANHEIDIDVNEANIVHDNISGSGTNTHAQIDSHIADGTVHFTQASISIAESQISDLQSYALDTHTHTITDLTDVFTSMIPTDGQVLTYDTTNGWQAETPSTGVTDHILLTNIGTNTHAQIDSHIADSSIHFTQASISITESQISNLQSYALDTHTHTLDELTNVVLTTPTSGQVLSFDGTNWINTAAGGGGDDVLVKVSANDTTAGYLNGKLVAGTGILFVENNDGGNETLTLQIDNSSIGSGTPSIGDILVWDGTQWIASPNAAAITDVHGPIGELAGTAVIPITSTTPLVTEGAPLWSTTVTPAEIDHEFQITSSLAYGVSKTAALFVVTVFRDNVCIGSMVDKASATTSYQTISFTIHDLPATTSPVTYSCRVGVSTSASWWVNTDSSNPAENLGGTIGQNSYMILEKTP